MPPLIPGKWGMGENTYAWYSRLKVRPEIVARADALVKKYGLDLSNTSEFPVGVVRLAWMMSGTMRVRPSKTIFPTLTG